MFLTRCVVFGAWLALVASTTAYTTELCVTVHDELDLPLRGSWINVKEAATAKAYGNRADEKGRACFRLPEGIYSLESGHLGFLNVRYYPIRVLAAKPLTDIVMRLPIGEVTEGGLSQDAVLSGKVQIDDKPVQSGTVCILQKHPRVPVSCGLTDEFGEYVIIVTPGTYDLEIHASQHLLYSSTVDLSTTGLHRNRVVIPLANAGR